MSNCQHCGAAVPSGATNCGSCGAPTSRESPPDRAADSGDETRVDGSRSPSAYEHSRRTPRPDNATAPPGRSRSDPTTGAQRSTQSNPVSTSSSSPRNENATARSGSPRNENATARSGSPGNENATSPRGPVEPTGVKVLAAILGLFGGIQILLGLTSLGLLGQASRVGASAAGAAISLLVILIVLFGVGYLAVAFGLWTFRAWGWGAGVVLAGIGAVGSLLGIGMGATGAGLVVGLLLNAGVLFYLLTSRARYGYVSRLRHGPAQLGAGIV